MKLDPSIDQILKSLQKQLAALYAKMGAVSDAKIAHAIVTESQEILHRINLAQNLVLIDIANKLAEPVKNVAAADAQLTEDLKTIASVSTLIDSVTKYLGYIDKAIDIAKTIASV